MNGLTLTVKNNESGVLDTYSYECHSKTKAIAIIDTTLQLCKTNGFTLVDMEMI